MPAAVNGLKECTKCKETKKVDEFHKASKYRDGLVSACRSCRSEESAKRWRLSNKDESRERSRKWYLENREAKLAANRAWKAENPHRVRETSEKWKEANPDKVLQYSKRWREKNPNKVLERNDKWRAENPSRHKQLNKEWYQNNPDKSRLKAHKRRALQRTTQVEDVILEDVWGNSRTLCCLCTYPMDKQYEYPDPRFPSLEHIVPLSRGGTHTYDNLTYTHLRCNNKKLYKLVEELNLPFEPPVV